jgi:hypothetical protein
MDELKQERKELYNAHKRALRKEDSHEVEEIEKRQTAVSQELKALRKEMAMCYAIARRSGAEEQNPIGKEQNEHEPRRRSSGTNRADVPQRS